MSCSAIVGTSQSVQAGQSAVASIMVSFNKQLLRRKADKLPLAILVHYNFHFSLIFAILIGRLVSEKHGNFYVCNAFQRTLLVPVYCTWLMAEIPRLYVGQKGVLRDKLPKTAAFVLLWFFPQMFPVLYLGFLQEIIFPLDTILGAIMLVFDALEFVLAWRFLRSIISRQ